MSLRRVRTGLLVLTLTGCEGVLGPTDPVVEYVVVRGDTLSKIAARYDVTVDEIRTWNGIEGDLIDVDQRLRLYRSPTDAPPQAAPPPRQPRPAPRAPIAVAADSEQGLPPLVLPPEQGCLEGPSADMLGDQGMVASQGLNPDAVRQVMDTFIQQSTRCVTFDDLPDGSLQTEITVACTGRVTSVAIIKNPGWPTDVADCVADVLRHAPLPAHDLPYGDTFGYPLRFTP